MLTSLLLAAVLAQSPLGIPQQPTNNFPDAGSFPQHLLHDSTKKCMAYSNGGLGWVCLAEEVPPAPPPSVQTTPQASAAPALPAADAAKNRGARYFDTTLSCTRETRDGLVWGACIADTGEECVSVALSGQPLTVGLVGFSPTTTLTVAGVTPTNAMGCRVHFRQGFLPIMARAVCSVPPATTNTVQLRFESTTPITSLFSVQAGDYTACVTVRR